MPRLLHSVVCVASAVYIAMLIVIVGLRVWYPYELEWLEGWMLDSVRQIMEGRPLYGPPSVEFVSSVYNPVYFYLTAALAWPMGLGFAPARLVSVLSTFGILALLIFRLNPAAHTRHLLTPESLTLKQSWWRRWKMSRPASLDYARDALSKSRRAERGKTTLPPAELSRRAWLGGLRRSFAGGLVAAGLYAASYRFSGAWMDVARADSLFLMLLLGAFLVGREAKSRWQDVLCGLGYSLAFFTKQTALAVLAVVFAGQFVIDRRRYWIQWLTFGLVTAGVFAALDWNSEGWYSYYTLDSALHFVPHPDQLYFLAFARLKLLPGLLATAVLIGVLLMRRWWPSLIGAERRERIDAAMWSTNIFAIALVISSWAVFRQRGTFDNVFMPACLGLAIGAGLAYQEFRQGIGARSEATAANRDWHLVGFGAVALLILQQFTVYAYNPMTHVPSAADRAAGDEFITRLREMPGKVLVWAHGHLGEMAGKGRHVHDMAFIDAAGLQSVAPRTEDNRRRRQQVYDTIFGAVQRQDFDWIVIDRPSDLWSPYYLQIEAIRESPREFTGRDTRVGMVLTRNPIARGGRLDPADSRWNFLFGSGWGPPGPSGRSVIGEDATIAVALEGGNPYQLQMGLRLPCGDVAGKVTVFAWWNGKVVAQKTPAACGEDQLVATLTPEAIPSSQLHRLRLSVVAEGAEGGTIELTSLNLVASGSAR